MKRFLHRVKWPLLLSSIAVSLGIVAVACAQPNSRTIENLFRPSSAFTDKNDGSINATLYKALENREGLTQYLTMRLAPVLRNFYEENVDDDIKRNLRTFNTDTDNSFVNQEQNLRNQYRGDYLVRLQTDILDNTGGNQANWKLRDVNNKIVDDFINKLFTKNFVEYVDKSVGVLSTPLKGLIENQSNWNNIKIQAKFVDKNKRLRINNDAVYAAIQDKLLDQFVTNENPNLVSRVVFTNETPNDGFDNYFNPDLIKSPTPSYQFQVFNKYNQQDNSIKGANGFHILASNLQSYVNTNNKTIDIPNKFSSDSGGKLLLKASDMFDTFDPSFSAAFIQGYLALQKKSKGAEQTEYTKLEKDKSIIENFFVENNSAKAAIKSASSSSQTTTVHKTDLAKIFKENETTKSTDVFKGEYQKKFSNATSTSNSDSSNNSAIVDLKELKKDNNSQPDLILARGKDGIHLMGVDGGGYYLSESGRDVNKQKQFLLFRALQTKYGLIDTNTTYDFKLFDEVKKHFDKNRVLFLFNALFKLVDSKESNFLSFPQFKKFSDSIITVKNELKDLVESQYQQIVFNEVATAENKVALKLAERNQPFIDNERNKQIWMNGLAAVLPYEQDSKTGHYNELGIYYKDIIDKVSSNTSNSNSNSSSSSSSDPFSKKIIDKLKENKKKVEAAVKKHVDELKVSVIPSPQYSQIILVDTKLSSDPRNTSLALNLALNAVLSSDELQNTIRRDYFVNDDQFKQAIDLDKLTFKNWNSLNNENWNIFKYTYLFDLFQKQANPSIFGNGVNESSTDNKPKINGVLDSLYNSLNLEERLDSNDLINYYSYLYTVQWLLKDNLKNLKQNLQAKLSRTTNSFLVWSLASDKDRNNTASQAMSVSSSKSVLVKMANNVASQTNQDFTKQEQQNPNYVFGSSAYNWTNNKTPTVNSAANDISSLYYTKNNGSSSTSLTLMQKSAQQTNNQQRRFGFHGIVTNTSSNNLPDAVRNRLFTSFVSQSEKSSSNGGQAQLQSTQSSGSNETIYKGALFSFGSLTKLIETIDNIPTQAEFDALYNHLTSNLNINVTGVDRSKSLQEQKTNLKNFANSNFNNTQTVQLKQAQSKTNNSNFNDVFSRFEGYIGTNKTSNYSSYNFLQDNQIYHAVYAKQINLEDVSMLGSDSLNSTDSNNSKRLDLSLEEFLSTVALEALNPNNQTQAINALIANAKNGLVRVGDNRLFSAISSQWVRKF
ncbi:DUF3713 domain-containing protein [Mycoplasmoides genitalium]|nr:DUF3713 domain-containing protein [Mycoplasmoides genitalium]